MEAAIGRDVHVGKLETVIWGLDGARFGSNRSALAKRQTRKLLEPIRWWAKLDAEQLAAGLGDVLLVGHDPDFSMAVHTMTGAQVRMKKGGLAGVERGELKVLLRPNETAAIGS